MRTWKRKERRKKGSFHKLEYLLSRLKKTIKNQPNKRAAKIFYMQKDQFRIDSKVFFCPASNRCSVYNGIFRSRQATQKRNPFVSVCIGDEDFSRTISTKPSDNRLMFGLLPSIVDFRQVTRCF